MRNRAEISEALNLLKNKVYNAGKQKINIVLCTNKVWLKQEI